MSKKAVLLTLYVVALTALAAVAAPVLMAVTPDLALSAASGRQPGAHDNGQSETGTAGQQIGLVHIYLPFAVTQTRRALLFVDGHVRSGSGQGLAGVVIYRSIASYSGQEVATTDANGYYNTPPLDTQAHRETIRMWAEMQGYTFDPPEYIWPYYGYVDSLTLDFVAAQNGPPASSRNIPDPED